MALWRETTFLEIQQLILNGMPEIKSIDLYNNQLDSYRGDENKSIPLAMPLVLIEFAGGDWEHIQNIRTSAEYFFRLHLVLDDYQQTNSASTSQSQALSKLDKISELANVLDLKTLTYAHKFEFVREELDSSRTNIINHILDFVTPVVDCSLDDARALAQVKILDAKQVALKDDSIEIKDLANNNQQPDLGGIYKIP